ncbi:MAG: DUF4142 domain-containing protein [Acetobacter peroxydans]|jgi:putative membrane protein|nr:DUF4142 domain-containing protein [Acetobacter peroxydans]
MSPASRFRLHALLPFMAPLLALSACTNPQPAAPPLPSLKTTVTLTPVDIAFAQKLNTMNIMQSATAKSAKTNAGRSDLATLGATIVQDTTSQQTALAMLVAPHTIALPTTTPKEDQTLINRLKTLHGPAFDRLYIRYLTREIARMKPVLDAEILASSNTDLIKLARNTNTRLSAYQAQIQ